MTNDTRSTSPRDTPVAVTARVQPFFSPSRSPFERLNSPEANAALQDVYQHAHRTTSMLVAAHAIFAIVYFSIRGGETGAIIAAILIAGFFWAAVTFARRQVFSRQAAALALMGFAALYVVRSPDSGIAHGLFLVTLAALVLYQDPNCVWPAAAVALLVYEAIHFFAPSSAIGLLPDSVAHSHIGIAAAAALIFTYCAYSLRKNSLGTLRKQSVLTSENARITAELEKTRQQPFENSDLSLGGSRSGLNRALASQESTSSSRITEERYRMVIETAFDAIVIIDADTGLIVDLNPRALEMLARSAKEVLGQEHVILYPPAKMAVYRAIFKRAAKGELRTLEIELADRNGTVIPSEVAFSVSRLPQQRLVQGVFRDLTERKRAEAEKAAITTRLQEAQRLESLNVLAGGIAHDFNNILMSILGFATIGKDRSAEAPVVAGYFAKIETSTLRAGELCRQMLAFAGRAQVSIHPGELNEVIRSFEEPLRNKLPGHIQLELSLWPELPTVNFDTAQLGQVIVSLVTNATEAIAELPGLIQIKSFGSFPGDPTRNDGFITPEIPGEYCAVVEVTDTGCGISAENLRRIFEPFFSTKFIGRGLGLSETLGMIRSHQGAIQVKSKPGEGSSFRLYFPTIPLLKVAADPVPPPPVKKANGATPALALVADDESTIRDLVGAMLEEAGFAVRYAQTGTEALEIFNQHPAQISLVLLDLAMPGIPSHYVLEKIRGSGNRGVRVLMMSGYSEDDALERCGNFRPDGFLPKPFSAEHLRNALAL